MMGPLILAMDIGTGSVRSSLFDDAGDIHFTARREYPTIFPEPGWSEQSPDLVMIAAVKSLEDALSWAEGRARVAALSFSSQMYSVMAVGRDGAALSPVLPWTDTRAEAYSRSINGEAGSTDVARMTGCPIRAIYPLSKIGWLRDNLDLPTDAIYLSIKDYVVGRLVGDVVADWSTASASGLFDIANLSWGDEAMDACGISIDNLPRIESPRHLATIRSGSILSAMGVDAQIVLGAGDAPMSNIGSGAISSDVVAINIGTSAAVRRLIDEPAVDPDGRLWTYVADEGHWVMGGSIGSAGSALDWLLGILMPANGSLEPGAHCRAMRMAAEVEPGADGLTSLPYLVGEQSPDWRHDARGAFVGLDFRHGPEHMVRATLEGIVFALRRVRDAIEDAGGTTVRELSVTGGLGTSPVVRQIVADVFGLPVALAVPEGSSRGAAILAWLALGRFADYEDFYQSHIEVAPRTNPDEATHARYDVRYEEFVAITQQLWSSPERMEKAR